MSIDFDCDCGAVSCNSDFFDFNALDQEEELKSSYAERLFSPPYYPSPFTNRASVDFHHNQEIEKANAIVRNLFKAMPGEAIAGSQAGSSVEVQFEVSWGGTEGTQYDVTVSGAVHDNDGNYVEGSVHQSSSGEGGANASAGHQD